MRRRARALRACLLASALLLAARESAFLPSPGMGRAAALAPAGVSAAAGVLLGSPATALELATPTDAGGLAAAVPAAAGAAAELTPQEQNDAEANVFLGLSVAVLIAVIFLPPFFRSALKFIS